MTARSIGSLLFEVYGTGVDTMGRRRFLVVLAAAAGAGGFWFVRRDVPESQLAAAESDGSASVTRSTITERPSTSATSSPAPTVESTSTTSSSTTTSTTTATTTTVGPHDTNLAAAALVGTTIQVIPRAAWGASAPGVFTSHAIDRITLHHSAVGFLDNRLAPARFRQHQNYHQSLGWPDIAYHLLIDRAGNVFEGRPIDAVGDTGTNYDPTGHFVPMCEGNFDEHEPAAAQLEALAAVVGWARSRFGTNEIAGHRDVASTACPGDALASRIGDVVASSDRYLGFDLVLMSAEEGAQRVAEIEA